MGYDGECSSIGFGTYCTQIVGNMHAHMHLK
jgi:hypothetical protein